MKKSKQPRPPKLTDPERYKRFLDTADKVEASDNKDDLDRALLRIASPRRHLDRDQEDFQSRENDEPR